MLPDQLPGVRGWRPPALSHGLSLAQPWAWCVVHGPRRVENRASWFWTPETVAIWTGARIAIHASKTWDQEGQVFIRSRGVRCPMQVEVSAGAVIGAATIERFAWGFDDAIAPDQAQWAFGPMQIVLSDVVAIPKPIPCRGFVRLWWLPAAVQQELVEQLRDPGDR